MQVVASNPTELKTVSSPRVQANDKVASSVSSTSYSFSSGSQTLAADLVSISSLSESSIPSTLMPLSEANNASDIASDDVGGGSRSEVSRGLVEARGSEENVAGESEQDADGGNGEPASQEAGGERAERSDDDSGTNGNQLTPAEEGVVAELAARDAEVKAHERAHQAVGGQYAGSVSYAYQQGPDGKRYAVGGEVPIDVAPISGDPQATINKMRTVKAAALAPSEPSPQDRNVAATAARLLVQAQVQLAEEKRQEAIEAREKAPDRDEQRREAIKTYENFIGLGRKEIDPKDLIDELI